MKIARPKGVLFAWQRAVRADETLNPTQKFVAIMLSTWMDSQGAGAYTSTPVIARACGYADRRPVQKALRSLESKGYLHTEQRDGRSSLYTATFPDPVLGEHQVAADDPVLETTQVDEEGRPQNRGGGTPEAPGGGTPNDPLSIQVSPQLSGAPIPAPSQATPEQALEQLRGLVERHSTLNGFELPAEVRAAAEEKFRAKSNQLLRLCGSMPEAKAKAA